MQSDWAVGGIGILAGLLIYAYAWAATRQNLTTGATLPPPEPPAEDDGVVVIHLPLSTEEAQRRGIAPAEGQTVAVVVPPPATISPARRPAGIL